MSITSTSSATVCIDTTIYGTRYTNLPGRIIGYVVELAEPVSYTVSYAGFEDTPTVRHVVISQIPIKGMTPATVSNAAAPIRTGRDE